MFGCYYGPDEEMLRRRRFLMMRDLEGLTGGWTQKRLLEPQVPLGERNKKNTYLHIQQSRRGRAWLLNPAHSSSLGSMRPRRKRMTAGQPLGREGGGLLPVDWPASRQAKNSNVAYCYLKWAKTAQRMLEDYPKGRN